MQHQPPKTKKDPAQVISDLLIHLYQQSQRHLAQGDLKEVESDCLRMWQIASQLSIEEKKLHRVKMRFAALHLGRIHFTRYETALAAGTNAAEAAPEIIHAFEYLSKAILNYQQTDISDLITVCQHPTLDEQNRVMFQNELYGCLVALASRIIADEVLFSELTSSQKELLHQHLLKQSNVCKKEKDASWKKLKKAATIVHQQIMGQPSHSTPVAQIDPDLLKKFQIKKIQKLFKEIQKAHQQHNLPVAIAHSLQLIELAQEAHLKKQTQCKKPLAYAHSSLGFHYEILYETKFKNKDKREALTHFDQAYFYGQDIVALYKAIHFTILVLKDTDNKEEHRQQLHGYLLDFAQEIQNTPSRLDKLNIRQQKEVCEIIEAQLEWSHNEKQYAILHTLLQTLIQALQKSSAEKKKSLAKKIVVSRRERSKPKPVQRQPACTSQKKETMEPHQEQEDVSTVTEEPISEVIGTQPDTSNRNNPKRRHKKNKTLSMGRLTSDLLPPNPEPIELHPSPKPVETTFEPQPSSPPQENPPLLIADHIEENINSVVDNPIDILQNIYHLGRGHKEVRQPEELIPFYCFLNDRQKITDDHIFDCLNRCFMEGNATLSFDMFYQYQLLSFFFPNIGDHHYGNLRVEMQHMDRYYDENMRIYQHHNLEPIRIYTAFLIARLKSEIERGELSFADVADHEQLKIKIKIILQHFYFPAALINDLLPNETADNPKPNYRYLGKVRDALISVFPAPVIYPAPAPTLIPVLVPVPIPVPVPVFVPVPAPALSPPSLQANYHRVGFFQGLPPPVFILPSEEITLKK